jgi:poly-gamma-glutamate synthesis protein (capsule biosynthesis protein)
MYFARLQVPSGRLLGLELVPMQLRNFRLCRATRADAEWLCDTLNKGGLPVPGSARLRRLARLRRTRFNCRWELQQDDTVHIVSRGGGPSS